MMKQFFELKAKHPDAIMLFRCGDFYETYSEDAIVASEILGITLTKRANGQAKSVEMAGFPFHALDTYLPKLVRAGKRVAICDQLEDPKMTKKLVKRGITELVTPGVAINDNVLSYKENNFLAAVHFGKASCGVAFLDISTGDFYPAFLFYGVRRGAKRRRSHHRGASGGSGWRLAPRNNFMVETLEKNRSWTRYFLARELRKSLKPERRHR